MKGTPEDIQINTITTSDQPRTVPRMSFALSSVKESAENFEVKNAYILPDLNQSEQVLLGEVDISQYPHLHDLEFPEGNLKRVSILVGNNLPMAHIQGEVRAPEEKVNGLYAYKFPFGWSLSGPLDTHGGNTRSVNFVSLYRKLYDQVAHEKSLFRWRTNEHYRLYAKQSNWRTDIIGLGCYGRKMSLACQTIGKWQKCG